MRQSLVLSILMALAVWPGSLLAIDCAALADTDTPFAITSEVTTRQSGEAPTTRIRQTQVFRKGGEVTTYIVDSPAVYLRTRGASPLFPVESLYSTEANDPRKWTYSIGPMVGLVRGQPLGYGADMRSADGKLRIAARMTLELLDPGTLELEGCRIKVLRYRRTLEGLADGHPISNSEEFTFAPNLRAIVASTLRTGDTEVISTPASISVNFKRLE